MKHSSDSIRVFSRGEYEKITEPCPFEPCAFNIPNKYMVELPESGRVLLALHDSEKHELGFLDFGYMQKNSRMYINPMEIFHNKYIGGAEYNSNAFLLFIDAKIYYGFGMRDFGYMYSSWEYSFKDILETEGPESHFNELDRISATGDTAVGGDSVIAGPLIIFPNCTLMTMANTKDTTGIRYDWLFDVAEDTSIVSLVLLKEDKKYVRLLFNVELPKGQYAVCFAKYTLEWEPLGDGEYFLLERIGTRIETTEINLIKQE